MQNNKHSIVAILAWTLTFSAAGYGAQIDFKNPPQGTFFEQYYSLNLGKTKCGWAWYQLARKGDEIVVQNKTFIKMGRENLTINVASTSETIETVDGKPLRFTSEMDLAGSKTVYKGEFKGLVVTMHIIQGGQTTTHKFPVPKGTIMAWGDYLNSLKFLKQPGATFTTYTFEPQAGPGKVGATEVKVVGPAGTRIAGKNISGTKIIAKNETLGPFPITSYVDANGFMLSTEMQMGILKLQLVATSKSDALANVKTEEFFANSFIKLAKPLKLTTKKPLMLKLIATGKEPLAAIPETSMQKVIAREPNALTLQIVGPGMKRFTVKSAKATAANLASASYTKLDDPALIRLAAQGSKSAKKPAKIAENLCLFVHKYITSKNLETPFASASETARSKAGDCSEHAVLMAALARIKKIPSQVVSGIVYVPEGGPHGSFGYHMWTQVWLNGQWIDMDPTFGQIEPDATHIALATQDLADETFVQQAVKLANFIGQLQIEPAN